MTATTDILPPVERGTHIHVRRPTIVRPWTSYFGQQNTANFAAQLPASRKRCPTTAPTLCGVPSQIQSPLRPLRLPREDRRFHGRTSRRPPWTPEQGGASMSHALWKRIRRSVARGVSLSAEGAVS